MKTPLFSIIIPTIGRIKEFKSCLDTVLAEEFNDVEIIIQDNFTSWGLNEYILSLNDQRIRVNRVEKRLFMKDNWISAINFSKGKYVTILGDDDGWYKGSLSLAKSLIKSHPDIDVINWVRDDYGWPDAPPCISNHMYISFSNSFIQVNQKQLLNDIFSYKLTHEFLPKIYSSFFNREYIEKITSQHGALFLDPSNPDISSGVQSLIVSGKIIRSNIPFSIIGTSGSSNGANNMSTNLFNNSVGNLMPEEILSCFYADGCTADLSIANTYIKITNLLKIENANINLLKPLLLHATSFNLPIKRRILQEIRKLDLISDSSEILQSIDEIMSPNFIRPTDRKPVGNHIRNNPSGFNALISVNDFGVKNIFQASKLGEYIKKFYLTKLIDSRG